MTSSNDEPLGPGGVEDVTSEDDTRPTRPDDGKPDTGRRDTGHRDTGDTSDLPEKGYISDEQLPVDLQPTEDNPLAKDPDTDEDPEDDEDDEAEKARQPGQPGSLDGMPDMGAPGAQP